jgi:hypothetical protein
VPAHVTLLYPFVPADALREADLDALRGLFATAEPFDVELRELRRWPGIAYLAPEPAAPFVALTESLAARWPEHPPYAGIVDEIVPHLTAAEGDEADIRHYLPLAFRVTEATLLEEIEPASNRWRVRRRLPLGA